jgi:DNA topoisomerase-1
MSARRKYAWEMTASALRHGDAAGAGITRRRRGRGFSFLAPDGKPLNGRDGATRRRIAALAIPPAWTDVWIAPDARSHLQATGRDQRGRKQYLYHPAFRVARDRAKFARLREFGDALPALRARARRDLAGRGFKKERVIAAIVRLLDLTFARVGNEEYRKANGSFGLTTLENRHARVVGDLLRLSFRGKSGVAQELVVDDAEIARVVRGCQELPGQALFRYREDAADGGKLGTLDSADVNAWIREVSANPHLTAKDFRTWHATELAWNLLAARPRPRDPAARRRRVDEVIAEVARRLGNTRVVTRRYYVHSGVLRDYERGGLRWRGNAKGRRLGRSRRGLRASETALLDWLAR